MVEKNAPWRKASTNHPWTKETDPSSLAGDEWVAKGDIGVEQAVTKEDLENHPERPVTERFMHPEHDVES